MRLLFLWMSQLSERSTNVRDIDECVLVEAPAVRSTHYVQTEDSTLSKEPLRESESPVR